MNSTPMRHPKTAMVANPQGYNEVRGWPCSGLVNQRLTFKFQSPECHLSNSSSFGCAWPVLLVVNLHWSHQAPPIPKMAWRRLVIHWDTAIHWANACQKYIIIINHARPCQEYIIIVYIGGERRSSRCPVDQDPWCHSKSVTSGCTDQPFIATSGACLVHVWCMPVTSDASRMGAWKRSS